MIIYDVVEWLYIYILILYMCVLIFERINNVNIFYGRKFY